MPTAKKSAGRNPGALNAYMGRAKQPGGGGRSLPTRPGGRTKASAAGTGAMIGAMRGARAGGRVGAMTGAMRQARKRAAR